MAGREKIITHLYDEKGVYIQSFESMAQFRALYFPEDIAKSRPIFRHREFGIDYHYNKDLGIILLKERPGRERIKQIISVHNSHYCKRTDDADREVQLLNLRGEVIAEFKSQRILSKLVPFLPDSHITNSLKSKNVRNIVKHELFIRFKDN